MRGDNTFRNKMGIYINTDSAGNLLPMRGKATALIADGAISVSGLDGFRENLVCVFINPHFDAALYVSDQDTYNSIITSKDNRPRQWLIYKNVQR